MAGFLRRGTRRPMGRAAYTLWFIALAATGSARASDIEDRQDFAPVRAAAAIALRNDAEHGSLAGPRMPNLIGRWWAAQRRWTELRFDRHGALAARTLTPLGHRLDSDLHLAAIPLDRSTFLIAAGKLGFGTFFVIGLRRGRYRTLWAAPGVARPEQVYATLESWSPGASIGLCVSDPHCPALSADRIGILPAGRNGHRRFYVQATYRSEIGSTVGGQLTIWEWDGSVAHPLLLRNFGYMLAQSTPVLTVNGATVTLQVKGDFEHFFACGQCEGRQMKWRFRVEPGRIVDLGRQSLLPEVDLVDRVIDGLLHGDDVSRLSAPAPAAFLRRAIAESRSPPTESRPADPVYLGMVMGWRVRGTPIRRELCLSTDDFAGQFTLSRSAAGYRLVAARPVRAPQPCRGAGSRM